MADGQALVQSKVNLKKKKEKQEKRKEFSLKKVAFWNY